MYLSLIADKSFYWFPMSLMLFCSNSEKKYNLSEIQLMSDGRTDTAFYKDARMSKRNPERIE